MITIFEDFLPKTFILLLYLSKFRQFKRALFYPVKHKKNDHNSLINVASRIWLKSR